ncbi:hypothetical protein SD71_13005 [Cohnella kolymensis]|uniref:Sporulation membrane protein YtrI C-terminal domain-containing protein n=1 Tax=Cohnella kolymensis TaxID=1590652 RepID=A0ABR5A3C6_9BACL|nr:hypothetical protein [Cohnella kolymensis]KIL35563.1 hypothetical protein SD71_13005 [Cohnella kolymensis]
MRVPSFDRFQKLMQITAFFVCGIVVGSAVYSGLQNDQFNRVIEEKIKLEEQLNILREDLKIEKNRNQNVVKKIIAYVVEPTGKTKIDILTETELKKRLKRDLEIFVGRSIYHIDSDASFARTLLHEKIYDDIEGKDYMVIVKTVLVVDGVLQIWVEARVHVS